MNVYNELMNPVYSSHNTARVQSCVGMLAACFTGSDWGAWNPNGCHHNADHKNRRSPGLLSRIHSLAATLVSHLKARREAMVLGKGLARLPDSLLEDIGLTRSDIVDLQTGRLTIAAFEQRRDQRSAKTYWTQRPQPVHQPDYDWPQAA